MQTRLCLPSSVILVLALLLSACAEGTGPTPGATHVDAYVAGLGTWEQFAPPRPALDTATGLSVVRMDTVQQMVNGVSQNVTYACEVTQRSLTETPRAIVMFEPNASIMWPGNLIQGRSYRGGQGTFEEWSVRQRAPLRLSIDLLTGSNSATIEDPSLTTVQSAIGDLIQRAHDAGHRAGSSISFDARQQYGSRQSSLRLGMSADWLGGSAHATLSVQRNASERTLTVHFVQKMFTISIELPQSPGKFFSDSFTSHALRQEMDAGHVGPVNLPVYIASITYGRVLTYALTASHSEARMRAAASASFDGLIGGGSGYTESELRETLSQNNLRVVAIGGEGQNVLDLISQGDLKTYFAADAPLTTARPISYQLNYLGDNRLARVSETTDYLQEDCVPVPPGDVVSRFEIDTEDWRVENGTKSTPDRVSRNPQDGDWYIQAQDGGAASVTFFRAPLKFRGDKAAYYGGNLSYWLRWHSRNSARSGAPLAANDIILIGENGTTLTYRFGINGWPESAWAFRQVPLTTAGGWRIGSRVATETEMRAVLANVAQLKLRAEYRTDGCISIVCPAPDVGSIDRVILSKDPVQ